LLAPTKSIHHFLPFFWKRVLPGADPTAGVLEGQVTRVQVQGAVRKAIGEKAVVGFVTVRGVADDGVAEVTEVEPDLVIAAGGGQAFDQTEPAGGVAGNGFIPFEMGQRIELSGSGLRDAVVGSRKGFFNKTGFRQEASNDGAIALLDGVICELGVQHSMGFPVLSKQDDSAGRAVDSIYRVGLVVDASFIEEPLTEVVRILHRLVGPMDEQVTGFRDHQDVLIFMDQQMGSLRSGPILRARAHWGRVRCVLILTYFARSS
jgi:hypothetical protein